MHHPTLLYPARELVLMHPDSFGGGPGRSPTCDLRVRSALLYATELPGHSA